MNIPYFIFYSSPNVWSMSVMLFGADPAGIFFMLSNALLSVFGSPTIAGLSSWNG
jgi:hypothetical protein